MNDEEPRLEVGQFDPVVAFEQTLHDLLVTVETFRDTDAITPLEFLNATKNAGERLKAISTYTMAALMTPVRGKITMEAQREFQSQLDLEELTMTPEDRQRRMAKALRDIVGQWTKAPRKPQA